MESVGSWPADGLGFFTEDPVYRFNYVLAEAEARRVWPSHSGSLGPATGAAILDHFTRLATHLEDPEPDV